MMAFVAYLSTVIVDKDISLGNLIDIRIIEGRIKFTFTFGCKNVIQSPVSQLETPKNERKKEWQESTRFLVTIPKFSKSSLKILLIL